MKIKRLAEIPQAKANPDWFTGAVWHAALTAPPAPARLRMSRVRFEPGARTNWHTHPLGQTLWVVSGRGRVQVEGGPVVEIAAGDVVEFPPHIRHWHGAAPDAEMEHIAAQEFEDGRAVDWMEPVSDADYLSQPDG